MIYKIKTPDETTLIRKNKRGMNAVVMHKERGAWAVISWHKTAAAANQQKAWLYHNIYTSTYQNDSLTVAETEISE